MSDVYDVAIIGAGPAGLAAAIQLKRYGIDPLLLEKDRAGGLLKNANLVENYPGFPDGISGIALIHLFEKQYKNTLVDVVFSNVSLLDINNDGLFNIETNNEIYHSKIVIVASGTKARKFTYFVIPDEIAGMVFYEVFPLLNKRDKKIIIVGAGDAAFDYALNLSKHNRITILNRTNRIKCLPLLWERAQDNENIKYASDSSIFQVSYALQGGIMVEYKRIGGTFSLHADYLIGAIGRKPQLEFLSSQVQHHQTELQSQGLLYFIGDVKNEIYRQTSIAVGDGVKAAMQIYNQKKENHP